MSDEESEPEHVYFKDRVEWSNVVPIPLKDYAYSPCRIIYSKQYEDAMGYFRATLLSGEKSSRVLELLEFILTINPSLYTGWKYRYDCIIELNGNLEEELALIQKIALRNTKCYQVWQHRRLINELIPNGKREIEFTDKILELDDKNYHAWSYRITIVRKFNLWKEELLKTKYFIEKDPFNNSAWSQRYYVHKHLYLEAAKSYEAELAIEIEFLASIIDRNPCNYSPLVYCSGLMKLCNMQYSDFPKLASVISQLENSADGRANAYSFLIDEYARTNVKPEKILQMIDAMIHLDSPRSKYWIFRKNTLKL